MTPKLLVELITQKYKNCLLMLLFILYFLIIFESLMIMK